MSFVELSVKSLEDNPRRVVYKEINSGFLQKCFSHGTDVVYVVPPLLPGLGASKKLRRLHTEKTVKST